jgi:hypothetical protein
VCPKQKKSQSPNQESQTTTTQFTNKRPNNMNYKSISIDTKNLQDYKASPDIGCCVCLQVAVFPVNMGCMHVLCYNCAQHYAQRIAPDCPTCRAAIPNSTVSVVRDLKEQPSTSNAVNKFITGYIYGMQVACGNSEECKQVYNIGTEYRGYIEHEKTCLYVQMICPVPNCNKVVVREKLTEHLDSCEHAFQPCLFCGELFQGVSALRQHGGASDTTCPNMVECELKCCTDDFESTHRCSKRYKPSDSNIECVTNDAKKMSRLAMGEHIQKECSQRLITCNTCKPNVQIKRGDLLEHIQQYGLASHVKDYINDIGLNLVSDHKARHTRLFSPVKTTLSTKYYDSEQKNYRKGENSNMLFRWILSKGELYLRLYIELLHNYILNGVHIAFSKGRKKEQENTSVVACIGDHVCYKNFEFNPLDYIYIRACDIDPSRRCVQYGPIKNAHFIDIKLHSSQQGPIENNDHYDQVCDLFAIRVFAL